MLFNRILDDVARAEYQVAIFKMASLSPQMNSRKPERSNVQQAWMMNTIERLHLNKSEQILCVGCYEDTAHDALNQFGYNSLGIDPCVNGITLEQFSNSTIPRAKDYPIVYATSVIEHVVDDKTFIKDMCSLVSSKGYLLLTTDFKEGWQPGMGAPTTSHRFYTKESLHELETLLAAEGFELVGDVNWEGAMDFTWEGYHYAFATLAAQKV